MNKSIRTILLVVAVLVVLYYLLKDRVSLDGGAEKTTDIFGNHYFKFAGGSALRNVVDEVGCGEDADKTYYATLELGKMQNGEFVPYDNANCKDGQCYILPSDEVKILSLEGGDHNLNMENNTFGVLQLGTDQCTQSGNPAYPNNGVVIDYVLREAGGEPLYTYNGVIIGKLKVEPNNA